MFVHTLFFMHSPVQRKYAAKAEHGARQVGEDGSSLLDCIQTFQSNMSASWRMPSSIFHYLIFGKIR